jgi:hypothetical protein
LSIKFRCVSPGQLATLIHCIVDKYSKPALIFELASLGREQGIENRKEGSFFEFELFHKKE